MEALELITVNKIKFWKAYESYEAEYKDRARVNVKAVFIHEFTYSTFDEDIGLEYDDERNDLSEDDYFYFIKDKNKFLLAKIKYGI